MWVSIIGHAIFQVTILFCILFDVGGLHEYLGVNPRTRLLYTIIFNTFVYCQIVNEFNARRIYSELNIFSGIVSNWLFCIIIATTAVVQALIIEFGGSFTNTQHLNSSQWLFCISIALLEFPIGLGLRLLSRPLLASNTNGSSTHSHHD